MRIFFYAGACIPIHSRSLEERPLGGTETGLIRVAELLAGRGHEVSVFTSHSDPPDPPGSTPRYLPARCLLAAGPCDALVAVQDWRPLIQRLPARSRVYWTGDGAEQYINFGLGDRRVVGAIDALFAVSGWHADELCRASGFPRTRAFVVGNGVHLPWFDRPRLDDLSLDDPLPDGLTITGTARRVRKRLIFTSAPYRGLELVPAIFRPLKELHPELELRVFSGLSVYDRERPFAGPELGQLEALKRELEQLPGCSFPGNTPQEQLAREYLQAGIFFYPNLFLETSCIAVLEAQAAGCPIVTSALGALPETVGDAGLLVPGDPRSEEYRRSFIQATHRLLSDDELWKLLSENGLRRARLQLSWERVADRFASNLTRLCHGR